MAQGHTAGIQTWSANSGFLTCAIMSPRPNLKFAKWGDSSSTSRGTCTWCSGHGCHYTWISTTACHEYTLFRWHRPVCLTVRHQRSITWLPVSPVKPLSPPSAQAPQRCRPFASPFPWHHGTHTWLPPAGRSPLVYGRCRAWPERCPGGSGPRTVRWTGWQAR